MASPKTVLIPQPQPQPLYRIQKSPAIPVPLERHPRLFKFSIVTTWTLWSFYTIFQIGVLWSIQYRTSHLMWRMWIAITAEFFLYFQEVVCALNIMLALFAVPEEEVRSRLQFVGSSAPMVDVLITCCGEPIDIIINTATAAASQEYPSHRYRVFILDDGHDGDLREAIRALHEMSTSRNKVSVTYLSRTVKPGIKSYFKAGNLQFGIEKTARLGGSEILAGLDADMIPERDWLKKMVPHLIADARTALACPPQQYYNVSKGDPLGQIADFSMYFTVQEALNDRLHAAMCTGSGYVVKRKALEEIGGWPLAETGEDYMCSTLLSNAGWKCAFVRESLQFGLAPESLRALIKQRMRWTDAGIEVHQQFGYYLPGSKMTSQMTWGPRAVNILYMLRDYAPVANVLALVLLPTVLFPKLSDEFSMATLEQENLIPWLRRFFFFFFVARTINTYIWYKHIGISRVLNFQSNEIWTAPYMALRCMYSFLPARFNTPTFVVCGTITSPANERSRHRRMPLPQRILSPDMLMYTFYILYASAPLLLLFLAKRDVSVSAGPLFPFPGVLVKLLQSISNVTVPLRYMLWPPTVPEREKLVEEDDLGVKRPKNDWERGGVGNEWWWISTLLCEIWVIWACGL